MTTKTTQCCISGGGPAGIMLGFLLARSGIDVIVLEKWPDFFRDFRGDTIHPSTLELLDELDLLERFLALPHNETKQVAANIGGKKIIIADFTKLKTVCRFLAFVPQWDFLSFIAKEAQKYPGFHLMMETEATGLIEEKGIVVGVQAKNKDDQFEIRSPLVVGADGRHSTIRQKSHLSVKDSNVPIDVLWFRLTRKDDGTAESLGYVNHGAMMVMIDRDSYWQCAFVIRKGDFEQIKKLGLEAFRQSITALVPAIAAAVSEITDWGKVKLLSVSIDHLDQWYKPGLICIGDAAHAMSPVGGVGINLAIQDAVAAANILTPAFKGGNGTISLSKLAAIQQRRARPARIIQRAQAYLHTHIFQGAIENTTTTKVPWQLRLINVVSYLRRIPAYLVGVGFRPEHIETKEFDS